MGILANLINSHRGKVGEKAVIRQLNPLFFGKVKHRLINNLILIDENGKSHQIDHVEIRKNGIFCIETKNYKGLIFGEENQNNWTQCLYHNEKHQFLNPVKQNKSHIYHINRILEGKYKINSVIVMAQNNAKTVKVDYVINLKNLKSYLKSYDDGTNYSLEEMNQIYNKLIAAHSNLTNRQHVKSIKQTQKELNQGICPRCGSKLIERSGKYGLFFGCSNYPKCKFIKKK